MKLLGQFFGWLLIVCATIALATCIASYFTDIAPPSEHLMWALAAMVFAHIGGAYIDEAESK